MPTINPQQCNVLIANEMCIYSMYRSRSATLTIHSKHFNTLTSNCPSWSVLVAGTHWMTLHELWVLGVHENRGVVIGEHSLTILESVEFACSIKVFLFYDWAISPRALRSRRQRRSSRRSRIGSHIRGMKVAGRISYRFRSWRYWQYSSRSGIVSPSLTL